MSGVNRLRLLALSALLLAVAPAAGQQGRSGGGSFNSDAPVDVGADRIEVQDRADRAIFSGNVIARQGNLQLNAVRLTVIYANSNGIQIKRLEASGGVTLRTPSETARSQFAIYDLDRRIVTMIGSVTLTQSANHVQGGRLVLDLDSHRAVMDGGGAGGAAGGRVTGRFVVPRRQGN